MTDTLTAAEIAEIVATAYELGKISEQMKDPDMRLEARLRRDALLLHTAEGPFSAQKEAVLASVEDALSDPTLTSVLVTRAGLVSYHLRTLAAQMGQRRMATLPKEAIR